MLMPNINLDVIALLFGSVLSSLFVLWSINKAIIILKRN